MYILNIFENGVEGIKLNYPHKSTENIKKIIFLNNIVADNSSKKKDRLDYLKKLNRIGLTFYFVTEKDIQNISKKKWHELYNTLNTKEKKILSKLLHFIQYTHSRKNKIKNNKIIKQQNNKTKKMTK